MRQFGCGADELGADLGALGKLLELNGEVEMEVETTEAIEGRMVAIPNDRAGAYQHLHAVGPPRVA